MLVLCDLKEIMKENFSKLTQLTQLDLSKNGITELPEDFGDLTRLKRLDLFKNNLVDLPLSFYKLKCLQWLDLKANPIQESLPKLVGDCLRPAECQQCAKNIVEYYTDLYNEKLIRERKAKKLESERIAKQLREEEQVRQRRKDEKKKRLEEKKHENQTKKLENINKGNIDDGKEKPEMEKTGTSSPTGSYCRILLYFILLLVIGGFVMALVFKGNTNDMQAHINRLMEKGRTYIDQFTKYYIV